MRLEPRDKPQIRRFPVSQGPARAFARRWGRHAWSRPGGSRCGTASSAAAHPATHCRPARRRGPAEKCIVSCTCTSYTYTYCQEMFCTLCRVGHVRSSRRKGSTAECSGCFQGVLVVPTVFREILGTSVNMMIQLAHAPPDAVTGLPAG